jgi:predicted regulator of Ras-like GTPase activity (Roadblock/LC7/MglB family)
MSDAEKLREQRLLFYKADMDKIDKLLKDFLQLANATCALLVDKDGHLVTQQGKTTYDTDTVSALVAGSFAATKQMAKLLGEEEFSIMFHQGARDSIQLSLVGERTILAIIFNEKTTMGMVRLYSTEVAKKLAQLFKDISGRQASAAPDAAAGGIGADYKDAAKNKLDDLFGR